MAFRVPCFTPNRSRQISAQQAYRPGFLFGNTSAAIGICCVPGENFNVLLRVIEPQKRVRGTSPKGNNTLIPARWRLGESRERIASFVGSQRQHPRLRQDLAPVLGSDELREMFGITSGNHHIRWCGSKRERLGGEDYIDVEIFGIGCRSPLLSRLCPKC
jgi:hypothetical protein